MGVFGPSKKELEQQARAGRAATRKQRAAEQARKAAEDARKARLRARKERAARAASDAVSKRVWRAGPDEGGLQIRTNLGRR